MFESSSQINHAFGAPLLSLALLVGAPVPPPPSLPAGAEPPAGEALASEANELAVDLAIDTSSLEPGSAQRLQRALADEVEAALRVAKDELVEGGADARIELSLKMPDVETREYAIRLDVAHEDARATLVEDLRCPVCSEQQVVDQALALIPAALRWLEQRNTEAPLPPPLPPPEPKRLGALGIVGVAALSGGVATLISGGALIQEAPVAETTFNRARDQGTALIGVGGGALLVGVTTLLVDLTLMHRLRRQRRLELGLELSPTRAGLQLSGKF